jgi:hypothetical protein
MERQMDCMLLSHYRSKRNHCADNTTYGSTSPAANRGGGLVRLRIASALVMAQSGGGSSFPHYECLDMTTCYPLSTKIALWRPKKDSMKLLDSCRRSSSAKTDASLVGLELLVATLAQ